MSMQVPGSDEGGKPRQAGVNLQDRPLRVCYFGTYRQEYSRNQVMIAGLRLAGVDVIECHATFWCGEQDRVQAASGGWWRPAFLLRLLRAYRELIRRHHAIPEYDVMVVGYPGQLDAFPARLLSWLRRKPLVWDVFMSVYLVALERGLDKNSPFSISLLRRLEKTACRLPNRLLMDTAEYAAWFAETHNVPSTRFRLVPTGADERIFHPGPHGSQEDGLFTVTYHGTFIRNHGVDVILEAALLLADDPHIHLVLIGDGPEQKKAQEIARRHSLTNVSFTGWLEKTELQLRLAQADLCLGAFGTTPQSLMTVQNKIYEALAMGKPVISGDSTILRQVLVHGQQIYLCERENPAALAEVIRQLKADPALRKTLGQQGLQVFKEQYALEKIGHIMVAHLKEVITG